MWLYDSVANVWHMWAIASPTIGTKAWCGFALTADCTPTGGTTGIRCVSCSYLFTKSRPQRA